MRVDHTNSVKQPYPAHGWLQSSSEDRITVWTSEERRGGELASSTVSDELPDEGWYPSLEVACEMTETSSSSSIKAADEDTGEYSTEGVHV